MTLTTLITVNAVLSAIVVYGVVRLLAHSVGHDRRNTEHDLRSLTTVESLGSGDQIAA